MSSNDNFDENASRRAYGTPYTHQQKVPNIHEYRERQQERQAVSEATVPEKGEDEAANGEEHEGILDAAKRRLHLESGGKDERVDEQNPYGSQNRNIDPAAEQSRRASNDHQGSNSEGPKDEPDQLGDGGRKGSQGSKADGGSVLQDTSEAIDNALDPKQKRRNMKHMKRDHAAREVTDPVTHLKVTIHDTTSKEIEEVPENEPPAGSLPRSATGGSAKAKSKSQLEKESREQQAEHRGMEKLFPPPKFDSAKEELARLYSLALTVGLSTVLLTTILLLAGSLVMTGRSKAPKTWQDILFSSSLVLATSATVGGAIIWPLQGWLKNRVKSIWEDELWQTAREQEQETVYAPVPESTQWLNSTLSSIWPLINPDLFASLADTLEDVMQASLPKLVRMVSVDDLGQGSEAIRILGIRWLPTGAAAKNVSQDGKIKDGKTKESDRMVPGRGEVDNDEKPGDGEEHKPNEQEDGKQEEGEEQNIAEGMEAEEGDFVNVEVGFSYRASSSGKSLKLKSKNAHIFLAFYLPGGVKFRKPSFDPHASSVLNICSCLGRA